MNPNTIIQQFLGTEVLNTSTVTTVADVAGSLAGTNFTFQAISKTGTLKSYRPYFVVDGVGADPTLGFAEVDTITFPADTAGNYGGTYFNIYDGTSTVNTHYYVYFTTPTGVTTDPGFNYPEITTVTTVADVSGSLNSTYFTLYDGAGQEYYVWYSVNGAGVDPAVASALPIKVDLYTNASATIVASYTATEINNHFPSAFTATSSTNTLVITNVVGGTTTATADGTAATGFTFVATQAGLTAVATGTSLIPGGISVASGATSATITASVIAAFVAAGWSATGTTTAIITHPALGNSPDTTNGTVPTGFADVITQGVDPTPYVTGMEVAITSGSTAAQVATALYNVLVGLPAYHPFQNPSTTQYYYVPTISTNVVTITNRWPGVVAATADGTPATGFTFATTVAGSTSTEINMAIATTAKTYVYKPDWNEIGFVRRIYLSASSGIQNPNGATGIIDGSKFITAAGFTGTNGMRIEVCDRLGNVIAYLSPLMQNNAQIMGVGDGKFTPVGMEVDFDYANDFGSNDGEVAVDGTKGEFLRINFNVAVNIAGAQFYAYLVGHEKYPKWVETGAYN